MGMHVIFLIVASLFAGTLALENSNALLQATDSSLNNTDGATNFSLALVHYGRKTYYIETILQVSTAFGHLAQNCPMGPIGVGCQLGTKSTTPTGILENPPW
ncbi:hypothetical protein NQ317_001940 [Molorchus minor]|uniref:Uncharacterized protein n=1 Tax=Molorchus minor TaxID=1323400 RepID=A0ABQ9JB36_9CUCU|nr:hypothetical protein NQ317_001940 [Molorchus minor]